MLQAISFVVAGFLLVSIVLADTNAGTDQLPLVKRTPVAPTAPLVCRLGGHRKACTATSSTICSELRCQGPNGIICFMGRAPDGMWCGSGYVYKRGKCMEDQSVSAPTEDLELVNCD